MTPIVNHGCASSDPEKGLFNGEVHASERLIPVIDNHENSAPLPAEVQQQIGEHALTGALQVAEAPELGTYDPATHPELSPKPEYTLPEALIYLHRPEVGRKVHIRQIIDAMYKKRGSKLAYEELVKLIEHLNSLCDKVSLLYLGNSVYYIASIERFKPIEPEPIGA